MRRWAWIAAGAAAAALAAGSAYALVWDRGNADVIAPGTRIAGVAVGGLHTRTARALLEERLARRLERPLRLSAGDRHLVLQPASLGLHVDVAAMVRQALQESRRGGIASRILRAIDGDGVRTDVPLHAGLSRQALATAAGRIADAFGRPARPARVVPTATSLHILPQQAGVAVEKPVLLQTLATALLSPEGAHTLVVPTRTVEPRWTTATLARRYPSYLLIDREHYTLRLYRHLKLARVYPIAVGRAGLETPAGLYSIDDKQVNPSWHVPKSSWAGKLAGRVIPPGPSDPIKARWMGFYDGAGIHGTDETSSIGSAASHGCIRMRIPDVIALYPLVPLHTPIYVG